MAKLSVIIITKNEDKMLDDCLKSVSWVDEILVVDSGSTDRTLEIAKRHKAKIVDSSKGKSFSEWRNIGFKKATSDWIVYIDADERMSKDLKDEIKKMVEKENPPCVAYAIPRENIIFGKKFRHGGFWPDYVKRLFKKDGFHGWSGKLHEEPKFNGELGHLDNPLTHEKHETLSEMMDKTNVWSAVEAELMFSANHPQMNVARFISAMAREFWYRMIREKAFLDGGEGVIMALYQVFSRFVSYAKLWEMQEIRK